MHYRCYLRKGRSSFSFKQKTAYEMRISDWTSDVCSSDLQIARDRRQDADVLDRPERCRRKMGMPPRPCIEIGFAAIAEQYFVTDKLADQRLEPGARNVPQSFEDQKLGSRQREIIAREGDPE